MENYDRLTKVGEGTYGVVYRALHRPSGQICAMKKIRLHHSASAGPDDEEGVPATAIREVACLREIHADVPNPLTSPPPSPPSDPSWSSSSAIGQQGPGEGGSWVSAKKKSKIGTRVEDHVVQLLDVLHDDTRLHLVFEFVDCDLRRYMDGVQGARAGRRAAREAAIGLVGLGISGLGKAEDEGMGYMDTEDWDGRGLPKAQVKSLMYQLVLGLAHLHGRRILHRDLKPQNLLISPRGAPDGGPLLKIADFGLARTFGVPVRTYTHEIITLYYRPPEVLLGSRHYTSAVDMWSVGCIFAEIATGRPLFCGDSEFGQIMKIFQLLGTPDESCWPALPTMPDYKPCFPQFSPQDLRLTAPELVDSDMMGLDLLAGCLIYDSPRRASAKDALMHPYLRWLKKKTSSALRQTSASSSASANLSSSGSGGGEKEKDKGKGKKRAAYPTPPTSSRPRARSKLGISPMAIPVIVEPNSGGHSTFTSETQQTSPNPTVAAVQGQFILPSRPNPFAAARPGSPAVSLALTGMVGSPIKPSPLGRLAASPIFASASSPPPAPASALAERPSPFEALMASPSMQCGPRTSVGAGAGAPPLVCDNRIMASHVV